MSTSRSRHPLVIVRQYAPDPERCLRALRRLLEETQAGRKVTPPEFEETSAEKHPVEAVGAIAGASHQQSIDTRT
jgi:hypothetical protein